MIAPNQHEKNEWARFAGALYARRLNLNGHIYSRFAALPENTRIATWMFDSLQTKYRAWLCFDQFPEEVPHDLERLIA